MTHMRLAVRALVVLVVAVTLGVFGLSLMKYAPTSPVGADEIRGPHYLAGQSCRAEKDPVAQAYRVYRELWRTQVELEYIRAQPFGAGIHRKVNVLGKQVEIVLRDYQQVPGGAVFYGSTGLKKLSQTQVDEIFNDLQSTVREAATIGYRQRATLTQEVTAVQSRIVGNNVASALSDPADPDLPGLNIGDILSTPLVVRDSFVPDQIVFGPIKGVWGRAYLTSRFGGRRIIYYTPGGRVFDCLVGKPIILLHEMTHANPQMQPAPWAWQFDVEIWASLEEHPTAGDILADMLFHPYLRTVREIALGFFGYDSRRVREEIYDLDSVSSGVLYLNEQKYREHHANVLRISRAMAEFHRGALSSEFYADAVFSLGVNMKLCDESGFLEVAAASHWEVAGLGGLDATQAWLKEHEPQIREAYDEAVGDTGKPLPEAEKMMKELDVQTNELCPTLGFFISDKNFDIQQRLDVAAMAADYKARGKEFVIAKLMDGGYDR